MSRALITAEQLRVDYGGAQGAVLHDITVTISAGEIVTIVGPNGSGKSSLLRALLGIIPLTGGTIWRAQGLRIGYVPQKLSLAPSLPMNVARFLSLPRWIEARACRTALSDVGLPDILQMQMAALSGGQMQRVLLARALLARPQLLILDEPTQGLDQIGEAQFYKLIEEVRTNTGAAILMVSHDLHVVMAASDRVICLNGHICCQGAPALVSSTPEYRALFGFGTRGALALYRHEHDHSHPHDANDNDHGRGAL